MLKAPGSLPYFFKNGCRCALDVLNTGHANAPDIAMLILEASSDTAALIQSPANGRVQSDHVHDRRRALPAVELTGRLRA